MAAYKLGDPFEAIKSICEELKLVGRPSDNDVAMYLQFHGAYYDGVEAAWREAKFSASNLDVYGPASRLYALGLWHNSVVFERALSGWVGVGVVSRFLDRLGDLASVLPSGFRKASRMLVVPYYLRPGLICGFGLIGPKDDMVYMNVFGGHVGGFAGLCDVPMSKDTEVLCLSHPLQACRIRQRCELEGYDRMSVVAAAPMTGLDFASVPGNVVIWEDDVSMELLKRCLSPRKFSVIVTETPHVWQPKEKIIKLWSPTASMAGIHGTITAATRHDPVEVVVSTLLNAAPRDAASILEWLKLNDYQRKVLLAGCREELRKDLAKLLLESRNLEPVVLNGRTYYRKDGCWWVSGSRDVGDELVSEVDVVINCVCHARKQENTVLYIDIRYKNTTVTTRVQESDLDRDPAKTVLHILASAGVKEQPHIAASVRRHILELARMFHTPDVIMVQDRVGYDPVQNRFCLPSMSVDTAAIKIGMPFVAARSDTPCTNVIFDGVSSVDYIHRLLARSPETVAYWAAMSSVVSDIMSNALADSPRNTAIVGSKGSLAELIYDVIRMDMGLISTTLRVSKAQTAMLHEMSMEHQVPVAVDGLRSSQRGLAEWVDTGLNSIVLMDEMTAAAIGTDPDWTFVRADVDAPKETTALVRSEAVFPFVLQLALTTRPRTAKELLGHLSDQFKDIEGASELLSASSVLVSEGGHLGDSDRWGYLLSLLQAGAARGLLLATTGTEFARNSVVLVDPVAASAYIDSQKLSSQLADRGLRSEGWSAAVADLSQQGACQVVKNDRQVVSLPVDKWRRMNAAVSRLLCLRKLAATRAIDGG